MADKARAEKGVDSVTDYVQESDIGDKEQAIKSLNSISDSSSSSSAIK